MPRLLDAASFPCACVVTHTPVVRRTHRHHILPLSWGGSDAPDNVIPLCPSTHDEVHLLLTAWTRDGEPSWRSGNRHARRLAVRAWQERP
jgi:hypothetical protein